jgi:tetratricopeptide (TPR) repeat protein
MQGHQSAHGLHWSLSVALPVSQADLTGLVQSSDRLGSRLAAANSLVQRENLTGDNFGRLDHGLNDPILYYYWGCAQLPDDIEAAIDLWKNVPELAVFFAHQAEVLYKSEMFDEALWLGGISERIDPEINSARAKVYLNACEIRRMRHQESEAMTACRKAEVSTENWTVLVPVAHIYLSLDQAGDALRIAHYLLGRQRISNTERAAAYRIMARVSADKQDYQESLTYYKRIAALGVADAYVLFEMGEVFYFLEDYSSAQATLETVAEMTENETLVQRSQRYLDAIRDRLGKRISEP